MMVGVDSNMTWKDLIAKTEQAALTREPPKVREFLADMKALQQSDALKDVTFILEGAETIAAHRSICAARSPVFKAMFEGKMKEPADKYVEIDKMRPDVFRSVIEYFYTGDVRVDAATAETSPILPAGQDSKDAKRDDADHNNKDNFYEHLLDAASRFQVKELSEICVDRLINTMNSDVFARRFVLADQLSPPLMKRMLHWATPAAIKDMCKPTNPSRQLLSAELVWKLMERACVCD